MEKSRRFCQGKGEIVYYIMFSLNAKKQKLLFIIFLIFILSSYAFGNYGQASSSDEGKHTFGFDAQTGGGAIVTLGVVYEFSFPLLVSQYVGYSNLLSWPFKDRLFLTTKVGYKVSRRFGINAYYNLTTDYIVYANSFGVGPGIIINEYGAREKVILYSDFIFYYTIGYRVSFKPLLGIRFWLFLIASFLLNIRIMPLN